MNLFNRQQIDKLLAKLGHTSPTYRRTQPPYAVFDWDNTCVFLDVEEATLAYQLDNFAFAADPEQMYRALRNGLPTDELVTALLDDLAESYRWLHDRHGRLDARSRSVPVDKTPHLLNLRAKFLHLYQYLESSHGAEVAYRWMTYRFTAMTAVQVRTVTGDAVRWQLGEPITSVIWSSPTELPGRSGAVSVLWQSGLRLLPDMQDLHRRLREAGFALWVCTASFVEGIREISSHRDFGYVNDPEHVIGLELEQDALGCYLPVALAGSELTYQEGKSQAIRRRLVSKYGYGPALVAGDSQGDYAMLTDFPDTAISLVIDRQPSPETPMGRLLERARAQKGRNDARYLVQERDDKLGCFLA